MTQAPKDFSTVPRLSRRGLMRLGVGSGGGFAAASLLPGCDLYADDPRPPVTGTVWMPKKESFAPTLCRQCLGGCALQLRVRGVYDIVGLKGLSEHPVNRGRLCGRAYGLLSLYASASRLRTPLVRGETVGATGFRAFSWDDAEDWLAARINSLGAAGRGDEILVIGPRHRSRRLVLLDHLMRTLGGGRLMPFPSCANALPDADFSTATLIVSVGAELFEDWVNPVYAMRAYAEARGSGQRPPVYLIHIGARRSRTAAMADLYVPVPPGREALLADGLVQLLTPLVFSADQADQASRVADLAERLEVRSSVIHQLLDRLAKSEHAIAIGPQPWDEIAQHPKMADAVRRLNRRLVSRTHSFSSTRRVPAARTSGAAKTEQALSVQDPIAAALAALSGAGGARVSMVLLVEAEPLAAHPLGPALVRALRDVPTVVSTASYVRDAGPYVHLILPDALPPERWVDDVATFLPEEVTVSVFPPAVPRRGDAGARDVMDTLLSIWRKLNVQSGAGDLWSDYANFLRDTYEKNIDSAGGAIWASDASELEDRGKVQRVSWEASSDGAAAASVPPDGSLRLVLFRPGLQPDGGAAGQPMLQEHRAGVLYAPYQQWVTLHPDRATELSVPVGSEVRLHGPKGEMKARLRVSAETQSDVAEVPILAEQAPNAWCLVAAADGIVPAAERWVRIETA